MIYAQPGAEFVVVLTGAPTGGAGLGVSVIAPDGTVAIPRTTDLQEQPPGSGIFNATLTAPGALGDYLVVWDAGGVYATDQLEVVGDVPSAIPPGAFPWAPSVEEVAQVTPAYTRGGFDDDESDELVPGEELRTYTTTTSPDRGTVEGLIQVACEEIAGRVGTTVPVAHYGLARATAKWHAAASIAAGKQPAGTDDASGEYRGHIANFRASLDRLVELAAMGPTRLA